MRCRARLSFFFFFNDTATTEIYTLSLHDALPISADNQTRTYGAANPSFTGVMTGLLNSDNITVTYSTTATAASPVASYAIVPARSEEHTSELQSPCNLVCRLLLEKKKKPRHVSSS